MPVVKSVDEEVVRKSEARAAEDVEDVETEENEENEENAEDAEDAEDNDDDDEDADADDDDESVDADGLTDVGLYNVLGNFLADDQGNTIGASFASIALELKRLNSYVKRLVPEKTSK